MEKPTLLTALRPPKFLVSPLISRKAWVISPLFAFLSQLPARHLPNVRLRELASEFDNLRDFVVGQILFTEVDDLLFRHFTPGFAFQNHIGLDEITRFGVGHSHNPGRFDFGVLEKDLFDMSGEDRISLDLNEIPFTVKEMEITFLIHADQVSGSKPLLPVNVDQGLPGSL